jgi:pyruvate-ferredoxin/flavodoxin oxidoreductase
MSEQKMVILDGNEAAASVAYRLSEVVAIYPITPSSPMGEWADQWRAQGKKNIWGALPVVEEMQSEGGAAGAVHGALQAGAFGTTFTASQGLLLMIPNMFKIAGELTPATMHVTARTIGHPRALHLRRPLRCHGLPLRPASPCWPRTRCRRPTTSPSSPRPPPCESRVPFLHFFDGFRTSHEVGQDRAHAGTTTICAP